MLTVPPMSPSTRPTNSLSFASSNLAHHFAPIPGWHLAAVASGPTTPPRGPHNPAFANPSQSGVINLAIPSHVIKAVATIPSIHKGDVCPLIGQDFDLLQRLGQRVAVVGMACQRPIPTTKPPRLVVATLTLVPDS